MAHQWHRVESDRTSARYQTLAAEACLRPGNEPGSRYRRATLPLPSEALDELQRDAMRARRVLDAVAQFRCRTIRQCMDFDVVEVAAEVLGHGRRTRVVTRVRRPWSSISLILSTSTTSLIADRTALS
ncbi:MAG: hypothetical protein ABIS07_07245 [Dokdonella sp.]